MVCARLARPRTNHLGGRSPGDPSSRAKDRHALGSVQSLKRRKCSRVNGQGTRLCLPPHASSARKATRFSSNNCFGRHKRGGASSAADHPSLVLERMDRIAAARSAHVAGGRSAGADVFARKLARGLRRRGLYCRWAGLGANGQTHWGGLPVRPRLDPGSGVLVIADGYAASTARALRAMVRSKRADPYAQHLDRAESPEAPRSYLAASRLEAQRFRFDSALRLASRGRAIRATRT